MRSIPTTTVLLTTLICLTAPSYGTDLSSTTSAVEEVFVRAPLPAKWKWSLAPVAASQTLDVTSSFGMRELNPVLAGSDGRFGMRAAGTKLGVTGALLGVEYLIVRGHPRAARVFAPLNWAASAVTFGVAAHNYSIR